MTAPNAPLLLPRAALLILYTLACLPKAGCTYRGLAYAMGISSERAIYRAVATAQELGLVIVTQTGMGTGRGNKSVIKIGPEGSRILAQLGV